VTKSNRDDGVFYDPRDHEITEDQAWNFSVGRGSKKADTVVRVGNVRVGGKSPTVIAGPCSVDSAKAYERIVSGLVKQGVGLVRANLFKFRTLPTSFQGLEGDGIALLAKVKAKYGVKLVTEVQDSAQMELVEPVADVLQVGARSMFNTSLLKALSESGKPVLLKRMFSATLGEFLAAAEYLTKGGNDRIILCERGIRTFEPWMRFSLDVAGISLLRKLSHLPVIADVSHALGRTDIALPVAAASLAAGANGVMVETHCSPADALSDRGQHLTTREFTKFAKTLGLLTK
jgi:3-deoxy-7-phosphoheptulonate synthase / chorismate mutase